MNIMKTKLVKSITSYLLFACALVSLVAAMALGTSATAGAAAGGQVCSVHMLRGLYLATFDGYKNFGGNFAPNSHSARPPVQRRWHDAQYIRHGEHRGHDYYRRHRSGRNLYCDPDCTGTLSITSGPNFNIYVGPGAQKVWTIETSPSPASIGVSVGTATRLPGR